MSEATNIEWATSTGNPWIGCTKVSPGCANCYAAALDAQRFSRTMGGGTKEKPVSHWGKGAPRFRTKGFWKDAVKWNLDAGRRLATKASAGPCLLTEGGHSPEPERPRIFPSLCDWLDEEVPIEWLADFLKLIHDTPNLDWLLLTKRPEKFFKRLKAVSVLGDREDGLSDRPVSDFTHCVADDWRHGNVIPANVWIGTSVEDQQRADERIPELLRVPARVRFLSVEPLLQEVSLRIGGEVCACNSGTGDRSCSFQDLDPLKGCSFARRQLHWVIVGGESGPGARPCNIEWIRSIVAQCRAAGVPCFVKQLGSVPVCDSLPDSGWDGEIIESSPDIENYKPAPLRLAPKHKKGGDAAEWPEDLRVREFPEVAMRA